MQFGFIHKIVSELILALKCLNLVELFKTIAKKIAPSNQTEVFKQISIDIFIVMKWFIIILLWYHGINNIISFIFVWYMLYTNIFTYFYYHFWENIQPVNIDIDRQKRRFINLILAFSYSNLCFGYLYAIHYLKSFKISEGYNKDWNLLLFSVKNALTSSVAGIEVINQDGNFVTTIQVCISSVFISILFSKN
jgi:hypothetical protein